MLHSSETYTMPTDTLNRQKRYDCAMLRWIFFYIKAKNEVSADSLIGAILQTNRTMLPGHVDCKTYWIAQTRAS